LKTMARDITQFRLRNRDCVPSPKAVMDGQRCILAVLFMLASFCVAQHWEFEQVDTAGWGRNWVELHRHSDGRLFAAYGDRSGTTVRLAVRDSLWSYEDMRVAAFDPVQSFAVSRLGKLGLAYSDSNGHVVVRERTDSAWVARTVTPQFSWGAPALAYDTSESALVMFNFRPGDNDGVLCVTLSDSTEKVDTVIVPTVPFTGYSSVDVAVAPTGRTWGIIVGGYSFPRNDSAKAPPWSSTLYLVHPVSDSWEFELRGGGLQIALSALSLAAGDDGAVTCQHEGGGLYPPYVNRFSLNSESVDATVWASSVAIDSLGRNCLVFTRPGELCFAYRSSSGWVRSQVSTITDGYSHVSLELDSAGQPLVAFTATTGVWLARGVDIVGTEEAMDDEREVMSVGPTLVRGSMRLRVDRRQQTEYRAELLDAAGRAVLELRAGENDVRHLAPGVYFLVTPHPCPLPQGERGIEAPSAGSHRPSAVQKVILAR